MKKTGAVLTAIALMFSLAACGDDNYDLECDRGDQVEHDSDCGYVDDNGTWVWYSWVSLGQTSHSPNNWEPPAGVAIQEDEEGTKHKAPKVKAPKTQKPATKYAPRPASQPKINSVPKPVVTMPKTVSQPKPVATMPKIVSVPKAPAPAAPKPFKR